MVNKWNWHPDFLSFIGHFLLRALFYPRMFAMCDGFTIAEEDLHL